jgi:hypothetical protein
MGKWFIGHITFGRRLINKKFPLKSIFQYSITPSFSRRGGMKQKLEPQRNPLS